MNRTSRRWRNRLQPHRQEVVLSARIEYEQSGEQRGRSLLETEREEMSEGRRLREDVEHVIEHRLPEDLAEIFGIEAEIRVIACRFGSLTVFFGVVLSGIGLIASYSDFFDSIRLIREHGEFLLRSVLKEKYRRETFSANVHIEYPRLREPYDPPLRFMKHFGQLDPRLMELEAPWAVSRAGRRDGFFWFLLVLCALLFGALGTLVYAAVVQTYFP